MYSVDKGNKELILRRLRCLSGKMFRLKPLINLTDFNRETELFDFDRKIKFDFH